MDSKFCRLYQDHVQPISQGFLLAKRRVDEEFLWSFYEQFQEACKSTNRSLPIPELISLRNRYQSYRYSDLAAHQGIMHLSYQVSTMSIFEQYRMNFPLFFSITRATTAVEYYALGCQRKNLPMACPSATHISSTSKPAACSKSK